MSALQRNRYRKRLSKMLSRADDEEFLQLLWAVDALQSGRDEIAKLYINFPAEAATSDITAKLAVYKWELETLANVLLITPKTRKHGHVIRTLNCTSFNSVASAVTVLRALENAESGIYLDSIDILLEMHRIAHRQFLWQRGYLNQARLFRYAYIYGQNKCEHYFSNKYELSVNDFSLISFALRVHLQRYSWAPKELSLELVGVKPELFTRALALMCLPVIDAQQMQAQQLSTAFPTAYQNSILRQFPIVSFGDNNRRLRAPLLELVTERTASGLYYDMVKGGAIILNDANTRYEAHCRNWLRKCLPSWTILEPIDYGDRKSRRQTPDILIKDSSLEISLAIECKAAKLTLGGQFAADPAIEAKRGYNQIVEGVIQLWRFFSDTRTGVFDVERVAANPIGLVLTLDEWLMASSELREKTIQAARTLAQNIPEISLEDQKPIVFCSIESLEIVLLKSDEASFDSLIKAAASEKYRGWMLEILNGEINPERSESREFPFDLSNVLPWYGEIDDLKAKMVAE